jgi:hypothetical protein
VARNKRSFLLLGDVPQKRIYVCRANNTVGPGSQCEISVEGEELCLLSYCCCFSFPFASSLTHSLSVRLRACIARTKKARLNNMYKDVRGLKEKNEGRRWWWQKCNCERMSVRRRKEKGKESRSCGKFRYHTKEGNNFSRLQVI